MGKPKTERKAREDRRQHWPMLTEQSPGQSWVTDASRPAPQGDGQVRSVVAGAGINLGAPERKHSHYFKATPFAEVDVYRVLLLFGVTDPCLQHVIKKLMVAGGRGGGKDIGRDVQEAIPVFDHPCDLGDWLGKVGA